MQIVRVKLSSLEAWASLARAEPRSLFVPTTTPLLPGETCILEIQSSKLPNLVLLRAHVTEWHAAVPRHRIRAGARVIVDSEENPKVEFIERALRGEATTARRRRQSRLPRLVPVNIREPSSVQWNPLSMTEISAGGALLTTTIPLAIGADVLLQFLPPGAVAPVEISCRVSYQTAAGATGVRFLARDTNGIHRLRELIRRIRAS